MSERERVADMLEGIAGFGNLLDSERSILVQAAAILRSPEPIEADVPEQPVAWMLRKGKTILFAAKPAGYDHSYWDEITALYRHAAPIGAVGQWIEGWADEDDVEDMRDDSIMFTPGPISPPGPASYVRAILLLPPTPSEEK